MDYYRRREYQDAQKAVPAVKCENDHQKEVFTNAYYAACSIIGGTENITYDYPEDSDDYKAAVEYLGKHDELVSDVYAAAISDFYGCGMEGPGNAAQKHYRFAGKAFTEHAVEEIVKSMGY